MESLGYVTSAGFIILTAITFWLFMREVKTAIRKTSWDTARQNRILWRMTISIIGWAIFISVLSITGFLGDFSKFPPRIGIVLIIPLLTIITVTFSSWMKELLQLIPAANLVRLQAFRVFVEVLLWMLLLQERMPIQMSFEGRNFDILTGLTAPLAAWLLTSKPAALRIWNFAGLALLVNIVTIAILSMPLPFRMFMNEPANTVVAEFPIVLLPGMLVPMAYGLHFLSLRQLSVSGK